MSDIKGSAELPTFSGEYAEFKEFWKKFVVEVDRKSGFSEAEKLSKLKKP